MASCGGVVAVCAVLAIALVGCGGSVDSSGDAAAVSSSTFERIQKQVFNVSCSADSCHSHVGRAGDLVLEEGVAWDDLINHTPSNPVAAAHGYMRVMPAQPSKSLLLSKITNSLSPGEGLPMPYGGSQLSAHAIDVIRMWIAAGAPAEGRVAGDDGAPLGISETPGGHISLPLPAQGVQLKATAAAIPDGHEETSCHYFKLPSDVDLEVVRFEIAVSGGSHHIHLYRPADASLDLPDGSEVCNKAVDFGMWQLVAATQQRSTSWQLPPGVAYHFRAGEQLLMQTHFVNVGSLETRGEGQVVMNLHAVDAAQVTAHAGAIFGQDKDVFVPAHSVTTKAAECVFPNAMTLMGQTGHYHFRGRHFTTYRWDDGVRGESIYEYQGYDDPPFLVYPPDDSPYFAPGQGLEWECVWENDSATDFKFGPFTDTNEHCNWFGFYYPTQTPDEFITCVKDQGVATTTVRHSQ
jgi:hypothetical protein